MTPRRLGVAAIASLMLLGGCGGKSERGRGGEEEAARRAIEKLPAADRLGFYQLATVEGLIRSRAVVASGRGRLRVSYPDVADARRRLAALSPRDPALARARVQLVRVMAAVAARRPGAPRAALRVADAAYLNLERYQHRHPEVVGLVPD
jgi:hypothetical protein